MNTKLGDGVLNDRTFFPTLVKIFRLAHYFGIDALKQDCILAVDKFTASVDANQSSNPGRNPRERLEPIIEGLEEGIRLCYRYVPDGPGGVWWPFMRELNHFARTHAWAFGRNPRVEGVEAGMRVSRNQGTFFNSVRCRRACSICETQDS